MILSNTNQVTLTQSRILAYLVISFFYIISPGPAIFLAIYNGVTNGTRAVMVSALGNILSLMLLSIVSISGLSAILLSSTTIFLTIKITGACYLIYLGVRQLIFSKKITNRILDSDLKEQKPLVSYFKEGLFVAATNPKPIIFFAALFPQFLDTKQPLIIQFSVMTLIFMLFSFLSLSTYGYLAFRAKGFLSDSNNFKWLGRVSGSLFIGMGISLLSFKNSN